MTFDFEPVRAVYIHIPFCVSKCHYCDFASYPGMQALHQDYVNALIAEISRAEPRGPVSTIYVGGGTPTALSSAQLSDILAAVTDRFSVESDAEITFEANPGTVDEEKLANLRQAGFNRMSLGVQSLDDGLLKKIGRIHSAEEALRAYAAARDAGFTNVGIDLIHALPGQTLSDWQRTLDKVVELYPEHASLYELSIEEGTKFAEWCKAGELNLPDEDLQLDMYEAAISTLTAAGYEHYEVSNFARPGFRSRHNQAYWRNESYFGFGTGAVRYLGGLRCSLTPSVERYISSIRQGLDPVEFCEELTGGALMGETVMLALRTSDGVDLAAFEKRFDVPFMSVYGNLVKSLQEDALVELSKTHLRLSHQGLLLGDRVSAEFLDVIDKFGDNV